MIRASGGMYNAAEFTITVTSSGTVIEEPDDTDGDGIADDLDTDDDNDGIPDDQDEDPKIPDENSTAATLDTDGDGIFDYLDNCSDTPPGEFVNFEGCSTSQLEIDDDNEEQ